MVTVVMGRMVINCPLIINEDLVTQSSVEACYSHCLMHINKINSSNLTMDDFVLAPKPENYLSNSKLKWQDYNAQFQGVLTMAFKDDILFNHIQITENDVDNDDADNAKEENAKAPTRSKGQKKRDRRNKRLNEQGGAAEEADSSELLSVQNSHPCLEDTLKDIKKSISELKLAKDKQVIINSEQASKISELTSTKDEQASQISALELAKDKQAIINSEQASKISELNVMVENLRRYVVVLYSVYRRKLIDLSRIKFQNEPHTKAHISREAYDHLMSPEAISPGNKIVDTLDIDKDRVIIAKAVTSLPEGTTRNYYNEIYFHYFAEKCEEVSFEDVY